MATDKAGEHHKWKTIRHKSEASTAEQSPEPRPVITLEFEQETDGRWICEAFEVPGAMSYGETPRKAALSALNIALIEKFDEPRLGVCDYELTPHVRHEGGLIECRNWRESGSVGESPAPATAKKESL